MLGKFCADERRYPENDNSLDHAFQLDMVALW